MTTGETFLTIEELTAYITHLSSEWMNLIGPIHHKDRDCHWEITQRWSYGNPPYWEVNHYGYLEDNKSIKAISYYDALKHLSLELEDAISHWEDYEE